MEPPALVGGVVILIALGLLVVLGWGGTLVLYLLKPTRRLALGVSLAGAVIALGCAALAGLDSFTTSGIDWARLADNSGKMLACGFGVGSACGIMVGLPLFMLFSFAKRKPAGDPPTASTL
jgi:hypothetical protein